MSDTEMSPATLLDELVSLDPQERRELATTLRTAAQTCSIRRAGRARRHRIGHRVRRHHQWHPPHRPARPPCGVEASDATTVQREWVVTPASTPMRSHGGAANNLPENLSRPSSGVEREEVPRPPGLFRPSPRVLGMSASARIRIVPSLARAIDRSHRPLSDTAASASRPRWLSCHYR